MVHNKHFFGKGLQVFLIGFMALLLTLKPSFAQVFPVQANITVVPPYSVYLSHYTSSDQEKVMVSILLRDPVIPSLDVKFRFTIEGAGIKLYTNPNWSPQPFNLTGGVLVNLPQEIIADYLKPQHLITEGVNPQDFFRGGKLPEGYYQFKVEVIEYRRNIVISNVGRTGLWLMLNEAPRIVFPLAGQKVKSTNPQMLNFSWTPSGISSPVSNLTTQYEFTLVEMVDKGLPGGQTGIDPNVAITTARNGSKFVKVLDQTNLLYGPGEMPLTPGKTYAIRVKAFNTEGYELYKNNGYSQVQTFTFGDACPVPISLTLSNPKQSQFDIDVMTDPSNTAWQARFRENGSGEGDWSELKSEPNTTSKTTKGLKPKTEYEVQVRGLCGDITSDYTASQTITTTEMVDANRACNNSTSPFVVDQAGPLGSLKVNDVFLAALFPVKVKEITKQGGGKFSGRGFATLPLFNTGLAVTFDDISINSLMQLTAGEVVVVRDKLNMTLFGETENPNGGGAGDGTGGDSGGGTADNPDYPPIKDTIVIPAVYDTLIVTGNTITYYLPNSTEPVTITIPSDGSTLVVPADGNMANAKIVYDGAAHPYTPNQGGTSTADPVNFTGLFARFKANPQQKYGFDTLNPKHITIANYYKQLTFGGKKYNLPWKALKENTPEPVSLFIKQGTDKMPFSNLKVDQTGKGTLTPIVGAGTGAQTFNITGSYKGAEESVVAYYTLDGKDQNAGAIYLATYGDLKCKLYLVPLAGVNIPSGIKERLTAELTAIYSQAVTSWNVDVLEGFSGIDLGDNGLDWASKEMLSSYNQEMNSLISAFKSWKNDLDTDASYLFIVPKFSEGNVEGFMPRNRRFGFVTQTQLDARTVAHELGHGTFNLHHTFSSSGWGITEKSTDNLMDYNSGTKLWKPQWDYIHNPEATTGLFDGMEDGAYMAQVVQCLSGAAVDFALYYSITWVSMFFDDEIKDAPSLVDFSKVTGYKEFSWKEAGVSAGTSCIASVIPALSSSDNVKKLSLAISAFAGAAEGMATELAKQYDITSARLQKEGKSSSMSDVIVQIDWVPVLSNAGISAAVTAFSTYVVTNPKYAVLLNRIKEKLKVTGSNFTEELLAFINKRLGRTIVEGSEELINFVKKGLSQKIIDIEVIWNTKYPIQEMLEGRCFFEEIMGHYRYSKSLGWAHTGDIDSYFKGVDFYKDYTVSGLKKEIITTQTAVSMKTTRTTDVEKWFKSEPIQKNIRFLNEGLSTKGLYSSGKTMYIGKAEIHIYMPKANITPQLKAEWTDKLNTLINNKSIKIEIKALEDFVK